MKHELVKWLSIDLDIGMIMGSNLGNFTLNFIFARISFGINMKARNPSSQGRAGKPS